MSIKHHEKLSKTIIYLFQVIPLVTFCLADALSFCMGIFLHLQESGIPAGNLLGIYSCILAGILPGLSSDILSGVEVRQYGEEGGGELLHTYIYI